MFLNSTISLDGRLDFKLHQSLARADEDVESLVAILKIVSIRPLQSAWFDSKSLGHGQ